jgi:folate-binding protein YgfZ
MFHVKHSYHHEDRSVILIQGEDRYSFLQGLITNDIDQLAEKRLLYTAMLTPQGKFLFDFFISEDEQGVLLDCLTEIKDQLVKKLTQYKLRSRVTIEEVSDRYAIYSLHNCAPQSAFTIDPRCRHLGYRIFVKRGQEDMILGDIPRLLTRDTYEHLRLSLGIPEAIKDIIPEKSIPLECGFDQLNAISWTKGCYLGQELTARTHYRGVVRKQLLPVKIKGKLPEQPNPSIFQDDQEVGTLYSHNHQIGIARLKLEGIQEALKGVKTLTCGDAELTPYQVR